MQREKAASDIKPTGRTRTDECKSSKSSEHGFLLRLQNLDQRLGLLDERL